MKDKSQMMKTENQQVILPILEEKKIELFLNLFRGREDVYPVLWQAKDRRKG